MKKVILISGLALVSFFANAQIEDCEVKGNELRILNVNGNRKTSIIDYGSTLSGFSSSTIAILKGRDVLIYNSAGERKCTIMLYSDEFVKNVSGNNILLEKGSDIITYDNNCNKVGTRRK